MDYQPLHRSYRPSRRPSRKHYVRTAIEIKGTTAGKFLPSPARRHKGDHDVLHPGQSREPNDSLMARNLEQSSCHVTKIEKDKEKDEDEDTDTDTGIVGTGLGLDRPGKGGG